MKRSTATIIAAQVVLLVYYLPVFARLVGSPVKHLATVHNCSSCFVLLLVAMYIFLCLPYALKQVRDTYTSLTLKCELYGEWTVLRQLLNRVFVPFQVLVFWMFQYSCSLHAIHTDAPQQVSPSLLCAV